ncbi:MAG: DUF5908 family protein [Chitinophagaceae bacterium]
MAIEIRELIIKATVAQNSRAAAETTPGTQSANAASSNDQLINTCVEKIMEILKSKNQR